MDKQEVVKLKSLFMDIWERSADVANSSVLSLEEGSRLSNEMQFVAGRGLKVLREKVGNVEKENNMTYFDDKLTKDDEALTHGLRDLRTAAKFIRFLVTSWRLNSERFKGTGLSEMLVKAEELDKMCSELMDELRFIGVTPAPERKKSDQHMFEKQPWFKVIESSPKFDTSGVEYVYVFSDCINDLSLSMNDKALEGWRAVGTVVVSGECYYQLMQRDFQG